MLKTGLALLAFALSLPAFADDQGATVKDASYTCSFEQVAVAISTTDGVATKLWLIENPKATQGLPFRVKRFEAGSCESCSKMDAEVTFLGAPLRMSVELLGESQGQVRANIVIDERTFTNVACEKTARVQ